MRGRFAAHSDFRWLRVPLCVCDTRPVENKEEEMIERFVLRGGND